MNSLRTVIVDDEAPVRKRFRQMLSHHPQIRIVGEAASVAEAGQLFAACGFDLVFLDIVMPGADGFSLVSQIPASAAVVFVTAHELFARRAFDVAAVDYLLKPVDPERLKESLRRVQVKLAGVTADDSIDLREGDRIRRVAAATIVAVERISDAEVQIHIAYDRPAIVGGRIGHWASALAPKGLVRVDRGLALRPEAITHLERLSRNDMVVELQGVSKTFHLGRTAAVRINRCLAQRRGS